MEAVIESVASELEEERKLRRRLESLNKKLGRELAETRGGGMLCFEGAMVPPKIFKTSIIVGRNRSHTFSFKSWPPYEKNRSEERRVGKECRP